MRVDGAGFFPVIFLPVNLVLEFRSIPIALSVFKKISTIETGRTSKIISSGKRFLIWQRRLWEGED